MPNTPSTETAAPARAEERRPTHAAVRAVSPGREEEDEKNQDRASFVESPDGAGWQFAVVCDGTTTSPFSAAAAEYVAERAAALFEEGGVGRAAEALLGMRRELLARPVALDGEHSELLRGMLEEIVRQKYQSAYQTTFVAVRLGHEGGGDGQVSVSAVGCGDSALFVFGEGGELHFNSLGLDGALDPFRHTSPLTPVLPDSYGGEAGHVILEREPYPEGVHVLLCTDGFYDGFENFKEMHDWLKACRAELDDPEARAAHMAELHRNLDRKKGDDDISFVWLYPLPRPAGEEEASGEGPEERPPEAFSAEEVSDEAADETADEPGVVETPELPKTPEPPRRNWLARLLAGLLNLFRRGAR